MNWDKVRHSMESAGSGGGGNDLFVKLQDGQRAMLVPMGEPYERHKHWVGGKPADCTGTSCQHCASGDRAKVAWLLPVFDLETQTAKLWELTYYTMQDFVDEGEDAPDWTCYEVRRRGTGTDTRYKVKAREVLAKDIKKIASKLEYPDPSEFGGRPIQVHDEQGELDDDIPF